VMLAILVNESSQLPLLQPLSAGCALLIVMITP
jgi:hypothetical protein